MAKRIKILALAFFCLFACSLAVNYFLPSSSTLAIAISLGVTTYHFAMRLAVGVAINGAFKNQFNHTRWWFRERPFEKRLYSFLRVRRWKGLIPTYSPKDFNVADRGIEYVLGATCQAELVHEIIVLLAFLPLSLIPVFGSPWVFIITSTASALVDCPFIILQRFNRPRLVWILEKGNKPPISHKNSQ